MQNTHYKYKYVTLYILQLYLKYQTEKFVPCRYIIVNQYTVYESVFKLQTVGSLRWKYSYRLFLYSVFSSVVSKLGVGQDRWPLLPSDNSVKKN